MQNSMKMIDLKSRFTLMLLALFSWSLSAQTIEVDVSGYVGFGTAAEPAKEYPVWIYTNEERLTIFTNSDGIFSATVKLIPDDTGRERVTVEVFDLCTGIAQADTREGLLGDVNYQNFRFNVCEAINPPDTVGCGAYFSYQSVPDDPQTIQFENLSYSSSPVTSWRWDFGDGATSDETNPAHTYEISGIYTIRLEMLAEVSATERCSSRYATTIVVTDSIPYNCPSIFDPVCVATPSGGYIRFANRCQALEQGFSDDILVECVDDCVCTGVYDPVCVPLPDGTVRRFNNRCEAACAGYGAADFLDCEGGVCPTVFEPVCVVSNGDTLTYTNACFALEAGFSDDELFQCEECLGICDANFGPPVCVLLADGNIQQFENECIARCKGFDENDFVDCSAACICPEYLDPVCVVVGQDTLSFDNPCFAECAGYDSTQYFSCRPDRSCDCPTDEYIPVCVVLPNGEIKEYVSACWAKCDGYTEADFVDCDSGGCICPEYYDPVCVVVGQDTLTFSNPCFAECEGFGPDQYFSCRDTSDCGCPRIYDPVCVKINGEIREFANECIAACNGFTPDNFVDCDSGACICPEYYDPVCTVVNGDTLTFDNICFASCEGFTDDQLFTCNPQRDCNCTLEYDPVCVIAPDGDIQEFSNACFAKCEGYTEADFVACPTRCDCPFEIFEPVCVVENGDTLTFDNPCFAECAGYTPDQWFHCNFDPTCGCPLNLDPVCVIVNDIPRRFPNACTARCFGFTDADFVDCDTIGGVGGCGCIEIYDPVCVFDGQEFITYSNACFALCDGYIADDFVDCPDDPDKACNASFEIILENLADRSFRFIDNSTSREGTIESWVWEFGDGAVAEGPAVAHTYREPGLYTVFLTITTSEGCSSSTGYDILLNDDDVVQGPECRAIFFFEQDENNPRTFQFEDLSMGDVISWKWNFGDGTTSTRQNPTHTFPYDGVFYVELITRTPDCESRTSMVVYVDPGAVYDNDCSALFVPFVYADSLQIFFRNLSSDDAVEYLWNFGDGTTSTQRNPEHTYAETGLYEISLTITTASGCTNTFEATINLASQNFTGAPAFREVTTSTTEAQAFEGFRLYPNPVNETLRLEFTMPKAAPYQLSIYSLEGKILRTSSQDAIGGTNNIQLTVGELPPGMYLLRIQSHEHAKVVKFVKQ